ncbi:MAG: T9SS type A sorting domain-containing protein, partial [bacterium]
DLFLEANFGTVDIHEEGFSDLKVFPNPAGELLNIVSTSPGEYTILNLLGEKVIMGNKENERESVDISNLQPGFYLLNMLNGSKTVKFIKE